MTARIQFLCLLSVFPLSSALYKGMTCPSKFQRGEFINLPAGSSTSLQRGEVVPWQNQQLHRRTEQTLLGVRPLQLQYFAEQVCSELFSESRCLSNLSWRSALRAGSGMEEVTKSRRESKNGPKGKGKLNYWSGSSVVKLLCLKPWWRLKAGHTKAWRPCVTCHCMSITQLFISELITLGSLMSQCKGIYGAFEMSTYRWEVPPLVALIIPADAGRPRMTSCRCLYLFRGIWPREIAFGWENFDVTLKMLLSAPSLFFMEKEDVYPSPFLIPSSPAVCTAWDQPSDGCLKTSITKLKTLACVVHEHRSRCTQRGGYDHAAPMWVVHAMMAGPSSKSPSPFSFRKTLSWVVAILQAAGDEGLW